jgi:hypothetical protein
LGIIAILHKKGSGIKPGTVQLSLNPLLILSHAKGVGLSVCDRKPVEA